MRKLMLVSMLKAVFWAMTSTMTPPPVVVADGASEQGVVERFIQWMRGVRPDIKTRRVRGTTYA